ncbi:MAG: phosphatidylglycerophosphatase A [Acidobacteria bacterium]|nr:phosphatidylglycerophosphatase A [Acidobacteriota bacterium]
MSAHATFPVAQRTRWAWLVATGLGIGHLRPPGTWASATTVVAWWLVARELPAAWLIPASIAAAATATLIGIPAATVVARESGRKDPQIVVVDEIAGQLVALIGVAASWKAFLAALVLFRVFDILKPPPVRRLERVAGGVGIVLDDLMAGVYARLALAALFYFGLLT